MSAIRNGNDCSLDANEGMNQNVKIECTNKYLHFRATMLNAWKVVISNIGTDLMYTPTTEPIRWQQQHSCPLRFEHVWTWLQSC